MLGIKNIRDTIKDYSITQSCVVLTDTGFGSKEVNYLTEQGLYKVLMKSRKPIAEKFQDWVCQVIEEIRNTGEYKSNKEVEQKTKNTVFIDQFQNKPILYLGMVEYQEEQQIVKYGYTQDIKSTLKRHQESYGENFHYMHALECKEHYNLENQIQKHNDLTSRHVKKYNDRDRQELLRLDKNFNVKNLMELVVKLKDEMENDTTLRLREIELKQAQERTKQLQLELEILKLKTSSPVSAIGQQTQPVARISVRRSEQPQENVELVEKFINVKTEFSTKRADYVFIEDLYNLFETWIQEIRPGATSFGKLIFSKALASLRDYTVVRIQTGPRVNRATPRKVAIVNRKFI